MVAAMLTKFAAATEAGQLPKASRKRAADRRVSAREDDEAQQSTACASRLKMESVSNRGTNVARHRQN
jgi:hypothetical protein